jgi:hypothetical protein
MAKKAFPSDVRFVSPSLSWIYDMCTEKKFGLTPTTISFSSSFFPFSSLVFAPCPEIFQVSP